MTITKVDLVRQKYQTHPDLTKIRSAKAVELFLELAKGSLISGGPASSQRFWQIQN
ncbi:MAG: hypothetical protein PHI97_20225 [Desulfobulbus sp.]|nr:hypothetical protein [Desulfobulbus sp.]